MEENEITLLKNCKMSVRKIGQRMNLFSIFAVLGMMFLVLGGIALLYYSSTLPEDMPHYIDNLVALGGILLFVVSAFLVPGIVMMRQAVHAARMIKATGDVTPIRGFLSESRRMWHYMAWLMVGLFAFAIIASVMLYIYFLPTLSTI